MSPLEILQPALKLPGNEAIYAKATGIPIEKLKHISKQMKEGQNGKGKTITVRVPR